jgi:hypothetical protein
VLESNPVFAASIGYVTDLECSSDSEDAIVGFLGWETLQRELDVVVLFRDEVIASSNTPN